MNAPSTSARRVRWRRVLIDPKRLWIRHVPSVWPGPAGYWTDLGRLTPGVNEELEAGSIGDPRGLERFDDTVWLPPVAPEFAPSRNELLVRLRGLGIPVIDQRMAGEDASAPATPVVFDLFEALLAERGDAMTRVPAGSWALWPLIPGVTDSREQVESGLEDLSRSGVAGVHGVAVELDSRQRRQLAEQQGDAAFDKLFHGGRPSERDFAVTARQAGLKVFLHRPLPAAPRLASNRRLAAALYSVGELWRRLDRQPVLREDFFAAARRLDEVEHDMRVLIEEGNVDIVDWLPSQARELLREMVAGGSPPRLLQRLEREYLGDVT
jgi:hypothetical protein